MALDCLLRVCCLVLRLCVGLVIGLLDLVFGFDYFVALLVCFVTGSVSCMFMFCCWFALDLVWFVCMLIAFAVLILFVGLILICVVLVWLVLCLVCFYLCVCFCCWFVVFVFALVCVV